MTTATAEPMLSMDDGAAIESAFGDAPIDLDAPQDSYSEDTPENPESNETSESTETQESNESDNSGENTNSDGEYISGEELLRLRNLEAQNELRNQTQKNEKGEDVPIPEDFAEMFPTVPEVKFDLRLTPEYAEMLGLSNDVGNKLFTDFGNAIAAQIIPQIVDYVQKYTPVQAIASQAQFAPFLAAEASIFKDIPETRKYPDLVRHALIQAKAKNPDMTPWDLVEKAKEQLSVASKKAKNIAQSGGQKINSVPKGQFKAAGTGAKAPEVGGRNNQTKTVDPTEAALREIAALHDREDFRSTL